MTEKMAELKLSAESAEDQACKYFVLHTFTII